MSPPGSSRRRWELKAEGATVKLGCACTQAGGAVRAKDKPVVCPACRTVHAPSRIDLCSPPSTSPNRPPPIPTGVDLDDAERATDDAVVPDDGSLIEVAKVYWSDAELIGEQAPIEPDVAGDHGANPEAATRTEAHALDAPERIARGWVDD